MQDSAGTPRTRTAFKMTLNAGQLTISGGQPHEPMIIAPVALRSGQAQQIQARLNRLFETGGKPPLARDRAGTARRQQPADAD